MHRMDTDGEDDTVQLSETNFLSHLPSAFIPCICGSILRIASYFPAAALPHGGFLHGVWIIGPKEIAPFGNERVNWPLPKGYRTRSKSHRFKHSPAFILLPKHDLEWQENEKAPG